MSGLLNIGEMGALALHVMVELADARARNREERLTAHGLAAAHGASVHTLQKIIRRLVLAGFLEGARGVNGGMRLTRDACEISMLQVLECVEGPVRTNGCLFMKRVCPAESECRFNCVTGVLEKNILDHFTKTTLADLRRNVDDSS